MLQGIVLLLLATQMLHITEGAPTLGNDLVSNFEKNMDTVHGNMMAGLTNIIKPMADLVDHLPEAILGEYADNGIIEKGIDELKDLIRGGSGAFGSGVKLGSTLVASPFKLAGDGMMAMENMVFGKSLDNSDRSSKHMMNKRDLSNQVQLEDLIGTGLKAFQQVMSDEANRGVLRNKKALVQGRMLNTVMTMMDQLNKDMNSGMGKLGEIVNFIKKFAGEV